MVTKHAQDKHMHDEFKICMLKNGTLNKELVLEENLTLLEENQLNILFFH